MAAIGIDFDGVIHKYSEGWKDGSIYDEPTEGWMEALEKLLDNYNIFIFTSRSPEQIVEWFDENYDASASFDMVVIDENIKFWEPSGRVIGVTQRKLPAEAYVDDRAVLFTGSWEEVIDKLVE